MPESVYVLPALCCSVTVMRALPAGGSTCLYKQQHTGCSRNSIQAATAWHSVPSTYICCCRASVDLLWSTASWLGKPASADRAHKITCSCWYMSRDRIAQIVCNLEPFQTRSAIALVDNTRYRVISGSLFSNRLTCRTNDSRPLH